MPDMMITISIQIFEDMADRIEELEAKLFTCATDLDTYMNAHAALEAKLAKAVEQEMVRVCNAYAKDGNMIAATAIHDAWLCVQDTLAELIGGNDE